MKSIRTWFVPTEEPLLDLLNAQWLTTHGTLERVIAWAAGREELRATTAAVETAMDTERDQQRALHRAVRSAFSAPLDSEDIYELGERINALHRRLYLLLREASASDLAPDPALLEILSVIGAAAKPLTLSLAQLPLPGAADAADDAADAMEAGDLVYRTAVLALGEGDVRTEIQRRELYRRAEHVGDACLRVAHRAWYAVCKIE